MEEHTRIRTNKHVLSERLYAKNDENDENEGNIDGSLYAAGLNNSDGEEEDEAGSEDILNSPSTKITVHKPAPTRYIKSCQVCGMPLC